MTSPLAARVTEQFAHSVGTLPSGAPGAARRRAALEALEAAGLPGPRDENWKYANLRPLERARFVPASPAGPAAPELPAPLAGFARYVFIDGIFAPSLSDTAGEGKFSTLADAPESRGSGPPTPALAGRASDADQRFALLNAAFATDGAAIVVPAGARDARLEVVFVASAEGEAGASYPRIELQVAGGAEVTLVERHVSAGVAASFVASAVTAALARGAQLDHYRLQELAPRALYLDTLDATLEGEARYRLHLIGSGARDARSTLRVRHAGEHAQLDLAIASLGDRSQVQDTYALVEHAAPRARTEQTFRGIAAGRARVACNGKIVVAHGAQGTDSRQSLRGLLAGPEAEIDVRPQLEIYTDDVRCSHGATAGKLDDNMLFYLLSRGLDRESALRALKWAFLEDVIARIAVPELRRQIEARLAGQMQDGAALKELW